MSEKQEGDFITAYDTEKKTSTQAKISKIRRSFTTAFTHLWIAGTVLSVTPAHALQTESGEWVAAGQLQVGENLRSASGVVRLDSAYTESVTPTPVISYEVEGNEAYLVGEMPVVVAGKCKIRDIITRLPDDWGDLKAALKDLNKTQREALISKLSELDDANLIQFAKDCKIKPKIAESIADELDLLGEWKRIATNNKLANSVKQAARTDANYLKCLKSTRANSDKLTKHLFQGDLVMQNGRVKAVSGIHHKKAITETSEISLQSTKVNQANNPINNLPAPTYVPTSTTRRPIAIEVGTTVPPNPNPNEVYSAKVWVWGDEIDNAGAATGGWRKKQGNGGEATFFPKSWDEEKTLQEIAYARWKMTTANWVQPTGSATESASWRQFSSDGSVEIEMYLGNSVTIRPASVPSVSLEYGSAFPKQ